MDTNNSIDTIQSREDFVAFIRGFSKDFRDNNSTWENNTIGSYLDALAAWAEDMQGYYENRGESTPAEVNWKFIAQLLVVAKHYE